MPRHHLSSEETFKHIYFIADFPPPFNGNNIVTQSLFRIYANHPGTSLKMWNTSVHPGRMFKWRRILIFLKVGIQVLFLPKNSYIYFGLAHRLALVGQVLVIMSGAIRDCHVVVHHHSYLPMRNRKSLPIYVRFIQKFVIRKCTNIFLSEKMKIDYAEKWGHPAKFKILSNSFVPSVRFGGSLELIKTDFFTIIHVSNLSETKGSHLALDVMEYFMRSSEKFRAILMGGDPHLQFAKRILLMKSRYPNQFLYRATFDEKILYENLRKSDVLLLPSTYENEASPLVVHEAQYSGVICITSEAGTLVSEVIAPGEASKSHLDCAELIEKVEELASNKGLAYEEYYLNKESMRRIAVERSMRSVTMVPTLFQEK